ncbi:MAG TPA: hypothetical protein VFZ01_14560 [Geminicoccaceae bacterium]
MAIDLHHAAARRAGGTAGLRLPTVIASSVIRSAFQGQSHGGVYLVDLEVGEAEQVIDWNDGGISWQGRGGDRGLRGIAFHGQKVFLAASDEIFVFDTRLRRQRSIRCRYLRHCHEIAISGDLLYLSSTGFDSILVFDLGRWRFQAGYCFRPFVMDGPRFHYLRIVKGGARRFRRLHPTGYRLLTRHLRAREFDPESARGPEPLDMFHINNVYAQDGACYFSGTELDGLFRFASDAVERVTDVPLGTHNVRLHGDRLAFHDTQAERVVLREADGPATPHPLPRYGAGDLDYAHLERDHARQGFGRGLCMTPEGLLIAGSSPATISVFRPGEPRPVTSVNLSRDLRNAIHGLEIWPFDRRLADWRARTAASSPAPGLAEPAVAEKRARVS